MAALVLPMMVMMTGCSKDEPEKDMASEISGYYNGVRTGSFTMVVNGQNITIPMNGSGTVQITRLSKNRIRLNTGGDIFEGTITDNHISFDPFTGTSTDQTGTLSLTISSSGTISGTTIAITETYSGTYYYQGSSYPIHGTGSFVLTK